MGSTGATSISTLPLVLSVLVDGVVEACSFGCGCFFGWFAVVAGGASGGCGRSSFRLRLEHSFQGVCVRVRVRVRVRCSRGFGHCLRSTNLLLKPLRHALDLGELFVDRVRVEQCTLTRDSLALADSERDEPIVCRMRSNAVRRVQETRVPRCCCWCTPQAARSY